MAKTTVVNLDICEDYGVDWQATAARYIKLNAKKTDIINRIRSLHTISAQTWPTYWCEHCKTEYPCTTIKALDGEQDG
jgi:hypothetical protein